MDSSGFGLPANFTVNAGSDQSQYRDADLEPTIDKDLKALNTLSESPQDGVTRGAEFDLMVQLNHAFAEEREKNYAPASEQELADMLALSLMQSPQSNQSNQSKQSNQANTLMAQLLDAIHEDESSSETTSNGETGQESAAGGNGLGAASTGLNYFEDIVQAIKRDAGSRPG